ncbi:hypothetical protein NESM_000228300 [Novymonas esmeraldas]|uniref:Uncharacterized protein n=1 Tax=Novymonas esmeraldas TaxID=1808958 RepID=A0AAW0F7T2_9TRYP
MRARLERAACIERQHRAEVALDEQLDELLLDLGSCIATCSASWCAARVRVPDVRDSSTACAAVPPALLPGNWDGASEFVAVRAAMAAVQELVREHADTPPGQAATDAAVHLYTTAVRQLITRLIAPLTRAALVATPPLSAAGPTEAGEEDNRRGDDDATGGGGSADDVVLRCSAADGDASPLLFGAAATVRVPVSLYLGWHCGYALLDSIGAQLHIDDDDRAAAWLDLSSAALRCVLDAAPPRGHDVLTESEAPDTTNTTAAAVRRRTFTSLAHAQARALQCLWWWCSNTFTRRGVAGAAAAATPSPPGAAQASPSVASECADLWGIGSAAAVAYLGGTVVPTVAAFLHAAMGNAVFTRGGALAASAQREDRHTVRAELTAAVRAVRGVAQRLFPDSVSPTAASAFLRHVVHSALLPLAERVLEDPASLPDHLITLSSVSSVRGAAVAAAAPSPVRDGWSSDADAEAVEDEEGEWEEVRLSGVTGCSPSSAAPTSTLVDALDALERELGDLVREDSVVVTLRRL